MRVVETQHVEACWGLGFVAVNMPIRHYADRCVYADRPLRRWLIRRCADRRVYADTPLLCYLRRRTLRFYAVTPLYIYIIYIYIISVYPCIGVSVRARCIGASERKTFSGPQSPTLWHVDMLLRHSSKQKRTLNPLMNFWWMKTAPCPCSRKSAHSMKPNPLWSDHLCTSKKEAWQQWQQWQQCEWMWLFPTRTEPLTVPENRPSSMSGAFCGALPGAFPGAVPLVSPGVAAAAAAAATCSRHSVDSKALASSRFLACALPS